MLTSNFGKAGSTAPSNGEGERRCTSLLSGLRPLHTDRIGKVRKECLKITQAEAGIHARVGWSANAGSTLHTRKVTNENLRQVLMRF